VNVSPDIGHAKVNGVNIRCLFTSCDNSFRSQKNSPIGQNKYPESEGGLIGNCSSSSKRWCDEKERLAEEEIGVLRQ
jgi:hypothetical protein